MKLDHRINEQWIKASIIGTTWAASEIVLGSFFHNLRIPFSSNLLTGIGIIIMISSSYLWNEKGLFWRAGLICSLMKTMSPSAVIFGPMIAIFMEAVLLELSVRVFRKTVIGFIIGGMLAMSWNLFHKIVNFIILYGYNIIDIYAGLLRFTQKQLHLQIDIVWLPILFLLMIYCIMGLTAAIIGIRIGRKLHDHPADKIPVTYSNSLPENITTKHSFNYSIPWLLTTFCMIITELVLISHSPWFVWAVSTVAFVLIWVNRYKRALKQLSKPRFWVYFVIITMITAFVLNRMQSSDWTNGLMIGIQMNARAVVIILGFSVLGTELYNPRIRSYFMKTAFKQLPLALELSFGSLPLMIATIPALKDLIKNPVAVLFQIISQIEYRLEEMKGKLSKRIFIVTGSVGQGKTSQLQELIAILKAQNIHVSGILSLRLLEKGETIGYDIQDITTNERTPFLRKTSDPELEKIGEYSILQPGLAEGIRALTRSADSNSKYVVIDEVGKLELSDTGWAKMLHELLYNTQSDLILAVQDRNIEQVIHKWNLRNVTVFHLSQYNGRAMGRYLMDLQYLVTTPLSEPQPAG